MGAACERAFFDFFEAYNTINSCVNREITADICAGTCDFGATGLSNENLSGSDGLAAKTFDAKAGAGIVVDVLA